jgi:ribosomal-protein-alanine N-acetyltransferase
VTVVIDARRLEGRRLPQGPRVYLRQPVLSDRAEFLAGNAASRRLYRGLAPPLTDPRAFAAYLRRVRNGQVVGLLVCRREDDAIVGSVNLSQVVRGLFQSAYMGYQVFEPFANQRYMSEALPLVLTVVFRLLRLHRVEANIQPGNLPSIALVARAGFRLEGYSPRYLKIAGRWCDHERWAMTAETYRDVSRSR